MFIMNVVLHSMASIDGIIMLYFSLLKVMHVLIDGAKLLKGYDTNVGNRLFEEVGD